MLSVRFACYSNLCRRFPEQGLHGFSMRAAAAKILAANSSARLSSQQRIGGSRTQRAFQIQLLFVSGKQRASKQRFFGRMAGMPGSRLAGFSKPLRASGESKCFLTTQDSEELPSLTVLVLYPIHETKTTGKEKSRIPTILVNQNLVTQLSRFGILPNDLRTGKTFAITPTVCLEITI